jgi:hypothetical protein
LLILGEYTLKTLVSLWFLGDWCDEVALLSGSDNLRQELTDTRYFFEGTV